MKQRQSNRFRLVLTGCIACATLVITPLARAGDDLAGVIREYDAAASTFVEQSRASTASIDLTRHPANQYLPKIKAYAEAHARTPEAVPALIWMLKNSR